MKIVPWIPCIFVLAGCGQQFDDAVNTPVILKTFQGTLLVEGYYRQGKGDVVGVFVSNHTPTHLLTEVNERPGCYVRTADNHGHIYCAAKETSSGSPEYLPQTSGKWMWVLRNWAPTKGIPVVSP